MSNDNLVTLLTPTYNRSLRLPDLYESLLLQINKHFEWIIVDDGSTDNTKDIANGFNTNLFKIVYLYKKNGGKHTAINFGIQHISTELTMIVDSDDTLTEDAIQSIYEEWQAVKFKGLCGINFSKCYKFGKISGSLISPDKLIGNFIDVIKNKTFAHFERAEVFVTKILKEYPFPVFEGETYIAEGSIWCSIAKKYDMLFVNKAIYVFEYYDDGLTKAGRKLRINNPRGRMYTAAVCMSKEFSWRVKCQEMLMYISFGFFAKLPIKEMYSSCPIKWLFMLLLPIGYILYRYWSYNPN